jgi:hypothetical protein
MAIALAAVAVGSLVSIALFFSVGGVFGPINDVGNGLIGLLSAALAFLLVSQAGGWAGVAASVIGAGVAVLGTWLVMSGTTGFVLAGFVSTVGFGLIGVWLALVAWGPMGDAWFGGLRVLAQIAAVAMIVGGLVAIPAVLQRIDSYETMPGWVWLFSIGWIGVYVLLPVVMFTLGRRLLEL